MRLCLHCRCTTRAGKSYEKVKMRKKKGVGFFVCLGGIVDWLGRACFLSFLPSNRTLYSSGNRTQDIRVRPALFKPPY